MSAAAPSQDGVPAALAEDLVDAAIQRALLPGAPLAQEDLGRPLGLAALEAVLEALAAVSGGVVVVVAAAAAALGVTEEASVVDLAVVTEAVAVALEVDGAALATNPAATALLTVLQLVLAAPAVEVVVAMEAETEAVSVAIEEAAATETTSVDLAVIADRAARTTSPWAAEIDMAAGMVAVTVAVMAAATVGMEAVTTVLGSARTRATATTTEGASEGGTEHHQLCLFKWVCQKGYLSFLRLVSPFFLYKGKMSSTQTASRPSPDFQLGRG